MALSLYVAKISHVSMVRELSVGFFYAPTNNFSEWFHSDRFLTQEKLDAIVESAVKGLPRRLDQHTAAKGLRSALRAEDLIALGSGWDINDSLKGHSIIDVPDGAYPLQGMVNIERRRERRKETAMSINYHPFTVIQTSFFVPYSDF